jgi:hypothetical protein
MFIGPEDMIFLGDVSFQVTVQPAPTVAGNAR